MPPASRHQRGTFLRHRGFCSRRSRKRLTVLTSFLLVANVFVAFTTLVSNRVLDVGACLPSPESLWLSKQSQRFTLAWSWSHKVRNAAVYICVGTRNFPILNTFVYFILYCPDVIYNELYSEIFSVPYICMTHSCLKPLGNSHYVYAEFVAKTYAAVLNRTIKPVRAKPTGRVAVLVEPRKHPLYEYVVKQIMLVLDSSWSLQLFVSSENEEFVRERFQVRPGRSGENITIISLRDFGLDEMSGYGNRVQSAFSAHEAMYNSLQSEHVLWFQTDVILRKQPHPDMLDFAFVGSEWTTCEYPDCQQSSCKAVCGGGNSGLSLRRKSIMLQVSTPGTLPQDLWGSWEPRKDLRDELA